MQTITAKALIESDRKLTVQLPEEIQTGEYEVVLVLNSSVSNVDPAASLDAVSSDAENKQKLLNEVWDTLMEEVENVSVEPTPVSSEYQKSLIEKYRKQGLDL